MPGLQRFLNYDRENKQPISFDIDAQPEDSERILTIAYQFYFTILRFFLKQFKQYDKSEFSYFDKYSRSLLKK